MGGKFLEKQSLGGRDDYNLRGQSNIRMLGIKRVTLKGHQMRGRGLSIGDNPK